MDDIRAVMDAVSSEKSILFGHSEGGPVSALFSATYPERTIALISFGIFAKRRYSPDYPWAPTDQERQKVYDMIENSWGSGDMELETLAPSMAENAEFMEWLASYFRSGACPSAAMVLTKMNTLVNIVDILESIKVPVLMMQQKRDIDVQIEEGRFISSRIPSAQFIEFEGCDHLFWAGNHQEILETMKDFILKLFVDHSPSQKLRSILSIRIHSKINLSQDQNQNIQLLIKKFKGKVIHSDKEFVIVAFDGPSIAVHSGLAILEWTKQERLSLGLCVHLIGTPIYPHQVWNDPNSRIWLEEMLLQSLPQQLVITTTVKNLLSGAGLTIQDTPYSLKPKNQRSKDLFKVSDPAAASMSNFTAKVATSTFSESFLEEVIQCIDSNLDNEQFDLETLSREMAVSGRQLQRKLKAISNKSPNQLISSVRLHRAKELLNSGKFGVKEIAFQTGFSNPSYFSKCFKK